MQTAAVRSTVHARGGRHCHKPSSLHSGVWNAWDVSVACTFCGGNSQTGDLANIPPGILNRSGLPYSQFVQALFGVVQNGTRLWIAVGVVPVFTLCCRYLPEFGPDRFGALPSAASSTAAATTATPASQSGTASTWFVLERMDVSLSSFLDSRVEEGIEESLIFHLVLHTLQVSRDECQVFVLNVLAPRYDDGSYVWSGVTNRTLYHFFHKGVFDCTALVAFCSRQW